MECLGLMQCGWGAQPTMTLASRPVMKGGVGGLHRACVNVFGHLHRLPVFNNVDFDKVNKGYRVEL